MSLKPHEGYQVPDETARVAHIIFPKGNLVMRLRDEFGDLFNDHDFAELYPVRGQPGQAPALLAIVTLLQFVESLTDRQAADAVRTRIDWKYALGLSLEDTGFHHTVLSEFRTRLLDHGAEQQLFEAIVELAKAKGLIKAGGRQRSDSTHILGAMRAMTRLEAVTETLHHALNELARSYPEWLRTQVNPDWLARYGSRTSDFRLPKSQAKRTLWAAQVGLDGTELLTLVYAANTAEIQALDALETLRQVWVQNFAFHEGQITWRKPEDMPPAGRYLGSPYDPEARYQIKRTTSWSGYKVHLTESCDDDAPNLITNVETRNAAISDDAVTAAIHASLDKQNLLPNTHIADTGYVNSELLVDSRETFGIDLVGPTRAGNSWQSQQGKGFGSRDFTIDWDAEQVLCPAGQSSSSWTPAIDRFKNQVVKVKFSTKDCRLCVSREDCTRAKRRTITIRPRAQHEALLAGMQREKTAEFKALYATRAGVEGTISQGIHTCRMRRSRYFGEAKTHLSHLMMAAAMNLMRILAWLNGTPKHQVKPSAFQRLFAVP